MRKKNRGQAPHYGVANGMIRQGRTVRTSETEFKIFDSIRRAKRYMRTGSEEKQ